MNYRQWLNSIKKDSPCSVKINGNLILKKTIVSRTSHFRKSTVRLYKKHIEVNGMWFDGYTGIYLDSKGREFQIIPPIENQRKKDKELKIISYIKSFLKGKKYEENSNDK